MTQPVTPGCRAASGPRDPSDRFRGSFAPSLEGAAGFTLIEVVVALAVGSALLLAFAAMFAAAGRAGAHVEARALAAERGVAIPDLLTDALARAGRGATPCLIATTAGGALLALEGGGERHELFAARDGVGRPALYARTGPHPRQPWLEDVTAFAVLAGRDLDGVWRTTPDGGTVTALRLELAWRDMEVRRFDLPLPHAPCLWRAA